MNKFSSIFSQLLSLFSKGTFIVRSMLRTLKGMHGDLAQFVAMLFCQYLDSNDIV